jgi:acylphosphatase
MIRRTSTFSGHMQGVGFRYTAREAAEGFAVTGYVRNLPDGKVELVAEGQEKEIAALLEEIGRRMEGFIRKRKDDDAPATGQFSDFSVRH